MAATTSINKILSEIKQLDRGEQLALLQQIPQILKKPEMPDPPQTLMALSGLGRSLWKNATEIDNYIEEERQW